MAVATAVIITPAHATSASSSMSAEHARLPSPPVAGCRPVSVSPLQKCTGKRRDPPSVSVGREETMEKTTLTRRTVLTATLATTALATPFVRSTRAAATVVPKGKMVL